MTEKIGTVKKVREISDFWVSRLPLPNINPSYISFLALPLSLAFIFLWEDLKALAIIVFFLIIMSDWLDGVVARKHNRASVKGWLIDSVTDRLSEGIIFSFFFWPWFYFFLLNVALNFISYYLKKNIVFPFRFTFFIYLIIFYTYHLFS